MAGFDQRRRTETQSPKSTIGLENRRLSAFNFLVQQIPKTFPRGTENDIIWAKRKRTIIVPPPMTREKVLTVARQEMQKHSFDTFVDEPPSIAQGGRGVVVSGCPHCKIKFQSLNQFMSHLMDDVLPVIADRAVAD
jgi:hypothetical protein